MREFRHFGLVTLVFGTVAIASCHDDDHDGDHDHDLGALDGGADAGSTLSVADMCPQLAAKTCDALASCSCADLKPRADCVAEQRGKCEKSIVAYVGAVTLGVLRFDAVAARSCLDGFDAFAKTCAAPSNRVRRSRPRRCRPSPSRATRAARASWRASSRRSPWPWCWARS